jgi:hypothetical protein
MGRTDTTHALSGGRPESADDGESSDLSMSEVYLSVAAGVYLHCVWARAFHRRVDCCKPVCSSVEAQKRVLLVRSPSITLFLAHLTV